MMMKGGGWPSEMGDSGGVRTQSVQGGSLPLLYYRTMREIGKLDDVITESLSRWRVK